MMQLTTHGDVRRLRFWTRRSAAVGYDVSAYVAHGLLIDTGFPNVRRDMARALRELAPRGVIVTHWHEDHAGNAPWLVARLPTWLHPYTEARLRERQQVKLYRHFTWGRPSGLAAPAQPLDPSPFEVLHTPGHSPDHHVVYDRATGTLFSGDLWLGVRVRIVGAAEDPYMILQSLDRAIALGPERMFDAHRGVVERPVLALRAKRGWLGDTLGELEHRLRRGDSPSQVLKEVLGGEERTAVFSQGEYSRRNLVQAVLKRLT
jgi:glyoxylase-like metal-dependent hydrolase (beta-lactamase superfamily II)